MAESVTTTINLKNIVSHATTYSLDILIIGFGVLYYNLLNIIMYILGGIRVN